MAWVSLAIGAASAIAGGISQYQNAKKNEEIRKKQEEAVNDRYQENKDIYDRDYYADATMRADAQNMIQRTQETMRNRRRQAAGTAAVMGASEESVAAGKQADNETLGNIMSNIAAKGETRKDAAITRYLSRNDSLDNTMRGLQDKEIAYNTQKNEAIKGAIQGVASAAASYYSADADGEWTPKQEATA